MPYKDFSSFTNIRQLSEHDDDFNQVLTAHSCVSPEADKFFDDDYFLIYRRSEYEAQIELLCAKIFRALTGYGPSIEIVQQEKRFYIASRRIKGFNKGYPPLHDSTRFDAMTGNAATRILYYFLCGTDNHQGNFGYQTIDEHTKDEHTNVWRIDMAEAFDFYMLHEDLSLDSLQEIPYIVEKRFNGDDPRLLPPDYVFSAPFQREKNAMIRKIAETPFAEFESLINETLTTDHYAHLEAMHQLMLNFFSYSKKKTTRLRHDFANVQPHEHSLDVLINLFRIRHQRWQELVSAHPAFLQSARLADPKSFSQAMELYQDSDVELTTLPPESPSALPVMAAPYDSKRLFHVFPDTYFLRKSEDCFSSDILGEAYQAIQPTEDGMTWLAEYYAAKYDVTILPHCDFTSEDSEDEPYFAPDCLYDTGTKPTRYDFVLQTILKLRQSPAPLKIGFALMTGSHCSAVVYEKTDSDETIYQFDSLGDDAPCESIVSTILTKKYMEPFADTQLFVNTDGIQADSSSCYLFTFYTLKELLKRQDMKGSLRQVQIAYETKYVDGHPIRREYNKCHLPVNCLKVAQRPSAVPPELLDTKIKTDVTLSSWRQRHTIIKDLRSEAGREYPGQSINTGILDYGLKMRQKAYGFFCPQPQASTSSSSSSSSDCSHAPVTTL
ncbi:hypothetical protein [Legionella sp. CNM-4043-24]|uniref:hypothetical protein n=1 Tax=Legionella sp. CNM-4043-24 TaxID=3421646 RepID=UPI00403AB5B9